MSSKLSASFLQHAQLLQNSFANDALRGGKPLRWVNNMTIGKIRFPIRDSLVMDICYDSYVVSADKHFIRKAFTLKAIASPQNGSVEQWNWVPPFQELLPNSKVVQNSSEVASTAYQDALLA